MTGRDLKEFAATVQDTDEIEWGFCSWNSLDKKNIRAVAVTRPAVDPSPAMKVVR